MTTCYWGTKRIHLQKADVERFRAAKVDRGKANRGKGGSQEIQKQAETMIKADAY